MTIYNVTEEEFEERQPLRQTPQELAAAYLLDMQEEKPEWHPSKKERAALLETMTHYADINAPQFWHTGLAVKAGIENSSYQSERFGGVESFHGTAFLRMPDGRVWKAVGSPSSGSPRWLGKQGGVKFTLHTESGG